MELCPAVTWKAELASGKLGYLAEEKSKKTVKGVARFVLAACGEMQQEGDKLKEELVNKK